LYKGLAPVGRLMRLTLYSRVLKKAFLVFFNYGLSEVNSYNPFKLLDLKICAIWRYFPVPLSSVLQKHASRACLICWLVVSLQPVTAGEAQAGEVAAVEAEDRICRRVEAVLDDGNYIVFQADTVLSAGLPDDQVDLIFIDCNASIDCSIKGSLIMVRGELGLRSRSRVGGDLILIGGKMFKSRKAVVAGESMKTTSERCLNLVEKRLEVGRRGRGFPLDARLQLNRLGGFALEGYDRVDGFSISWGFRLGRPDYPELPLLKARAISATTRKAFGFETVVQLPFDKQGRYYLGLGVHSLTDTNDRWRLHNLDNAVKAFFAGHDYRYYFRRDGYTVFFRRNLGRGSRLGLAFQDESYYSLIDQSPFTLFGVEQFRPNLPVAPGSIRSIQFECLIDTRNDPLFTSTGFWSSIETEIAGGALGGSHSFSRLDISLKRWDTIGGRHHTFFWFKWAFADRPLPFQRGYTLGNTLRGYDNFAFSGDRMLLFHASYGFSLPAVPLIDHLFFRWRVETVYEAGVAFFKDDPDRGYGSLKEDLGAGFSGETLLGRLGVHIFQNFEQPSGAGPRVTFCLNMHIPGNR